MQRRAPAHAQGDPGLPIPEFYGADRLVLLIQDPSHIFAYWELSGPALDHARQALGEPGTPVLLVHGAGGCEQREVDLAGGNYYLSVAPGGTYRAELALRGSTGALCCIVASNEVAMPRAAPSERLDEEWMAVDETFSELLVMAGLPANAGSSATLARDRAMRSRLWQETGVTPFSSGHLGSSPTSSFNIHLTKP